jgi:NTE family protein
MAIGDLIVHSPSADAFPEPDEGMAIALSGGGYRAMLFHLGSLWRLGQFGFFSNNPQQRLDRASGNQVPAGRLERISSVSGGSITSAVLALAFPKIEFLTGAAFDQAYIDLVVTPIRSLASTTLAGTSAEGIFHVLKDIALPGSVSDHIADAYDEHLFKGSTLQDLPNRVRFVFNASNLQTGSLWRFSKPYMSDWRVGTVASPMLSLARAVAASSAFPPVLAPAILDLDATPLTPWPGNPPASLGPPFTTHPVLADGGVYDNLGLETCYKRYKTLLVSDAGKPFMPQAKVSINWVSVGNRCLDVMDNQVASLRKRLLIQAFNQGERYGAFWDIQQDIAMYVALGGLPCPAASTAALAQVPTDLASKPDVLQEKLINWGYAITDAAVRKWFNGQLPAATSFPYARGV